jgi:hypothetical protein
VLLYVGEVTSELDTQFLPTSHKLLRDVILHMAILLSGSLCHVVRRQPDVSEEHITPPFLSSRSAFSCDLSTFAALLGLHLSPEDGGDIFLRNVGLAPKYEQLQSINSHRHEEPQSSLSANRHSL